MPVGTTANGETLIAAYHDGDEAVIAAVEEGMAALGQAIADASRAAELDTVYLGEGMMNAADVLLPLVRRAMTAATGLAYVRATTIEVTALGSSAGLAGAGAAVLYSQQVSSGV